MNQVSRLSFIKILLIVVIGVWLSACGKPFVRQAPKNQFFLYQNKIEVKQGGIKRNEKSEWVLRLNAQLDDSAKTKLSRKWIFFTILKNPLPFSLYATKESADRMRASLFHLGYYHATVESKLDTNKRKITVHYDVSPGNPTRIASVKYEFEPKELQDLAVGMQEKSYLKINDPVTKAAIITETSRLVDSFRNHGYYKFSAAEIKVIGDTNAKIFTKLNNNPIKKISELSEIEHQKDSPSIKISLQLIPPADSSKLKAYRIRNVVVFSDHQPGDTWTDSTLHVDSLQTFIHKYHRLLYNTSFLEQQLHIQPGSYFNQSNLFQSIYQLSKSGIWQSVNFQIVDLQDTPGFIDILFDLTPAQKFGFETALEVSYSAASNTSNVLAGNLFGLSGTISLLNRNLGKSAVKMSHQIRAGIEFNNNTGTAGGLINSNEVSYGNTTSFPKLIGASIPKFFIPSARLNNGETFIQLNLSYNTRLNLFNLHSVSANAGWTGVNKYNWKWSWSPISIGFSNLFNQTDSFERVLDKNPFLRFSYNTALVAGMGVSFSKTRNDLKHPHSLSREISYRFNAEESGLTWGQLPFFLKYKRRFIKSDFELKHTTRFKKTTLAFRGFVGLGIPLLGTDTNRVLPFFKQYFGGGSNSMRAWPVRGIGPGGRPLIPYNSSRTVFNDRTGDMQIELNSEYRFDIAKIIPNTLTLRGAVFADIGNIWNLRNTNTGGIQDTAQFQFKNLYSQLGVSAGTGLRLDFNYFVVRLDFGFRFKRPELFYEKDGWKAPDIGWKDAWQKLITRGENDAYKRWRYENFNFALGIGYAF
jgi:outer membrane protein assembly factor BamA